MRGLILSFALVASFVAQPFAQELRYPVEDFHNRTIELPLDHGNPGAGTFHLYYELTSNFDFDRPTIFFLQDAAQQYGKPGQVDDLASRYSFFDDFNVVRYQYRGRQYSHIELWHPDGSVDWEKAYRLLSADQVVEDIERIRRNLFADRPDTRILLYGRSGGGYLIQRYLAKYSEHVQRAFIRAAPNPLIMKRLGYPESRYFHDSLHAIDPALYAKLEQVLERKIVPNHQLLWILKSIPYASEDPAPELTRLIEDLHVGKRDVYEAYLARKGFDFTQLVKDERDMSGRDIGMCLCPIEVTAEHMLDTDPAYIDPLYECLKTLSAPLLDLIHSGRAAPPANPRLEAFAGVETEVFYLAGRNDHVSDYRIGIELGRYFPNYEVFVADDNHTMSIHTDCYPALRNAFFMHGLGSAELRDAVRSGDCREWPGD